MFDFYGERPLIESSYILVADTVFKNTKCKYHLFRLQDLKKAGSTGLFDWWNKSKSARPQSLPGMLRRGSSLIGSTSNVLDSSRNSDPRSSIISLPTQIPYKRMSDLIQMACALQNPANKGYEGCENDKL